MGFFAKVKKLRSFFGFFLLCVFVFVTNPDKVSAGLINVDQNNGSCVSGTGQGDPYSVVYCQIQDAITDSASTDTIDVSAGSYAENIIISKSLSLETSVGATIAPSSGAGLMFRSQSETLSDVVVSGFTIDAGNYGILMDGNYWAETLVIDGLTIDGCTISGNSSNGLLISDGAVISNLTVSNSTIEDNAWNVLLKGSTISNLTFSDITFGANTSGSSFSFASGSFDGVNIFDSSFSGNSWEYIDLGVGWIGVANLSNVLIRGNTFSSTCANAVWGDSSLVFDDNEITLEKNIFPTTSYVHNYTSSNIVALNNWWGSVSGPRETSNPSGEGTTIDDDAFSYDPWCTAPFVPGTPSTTSSILDNSPLWTWTAAETCALPLNDNQYIVGWCQESDFSDCESNLGVATSNSYTQITDLDDGTWYFRVKAVDSLDNESNYSESGSTVIDTTGPIASEISYSSSSTDVAMISWTTNENGSSQIEYGLNTNYGNTTPMTDVSPRVTSHTVNISSLTACSSYHYRIISTDEFTNQSVSDDLIFTTSGCPGEAEVQEQTSAEIEVAVGGEVSLESMSLVVPENFSSEDANFQIKKIDSSLALKSTSLPSSSFNLGSAGNNNGNDLVGEHIYHLSALTDLETTIDNFDKNITISINFSDLEAYNLDSSTFFIFRWDGELWHKLETSIDSENNIASALTDQFSTFALFAKSYNHPVSSNENGAPSCTAIYPVKEPIVYLVTSNSQRSATVYFYYPPEAQDKEFISHYSLLYTDEVKGEYKYYVDNIGDKNTSHFTVDFLKPGKSYYFKVKANRDCAPGNYSKAVSTTTMTTKSLLMDGHLRTEITEIETKATDQSDQEESEQANLDLDNFRLTVKVVNEQNQPIVNAKVEIHSEPQIAYTDKEGSVSFSNIARGKHSLFVSYGQYEGQEELNLTDSSVRELKITIQVKKKNNYWLYLSITTSIIFILTTAYLVFKGYNVNNGH